MKTAVEIENVTKRYAEVVALNSVSLSIADNEFFTLLGPSGCGKTTLLRSIAGFENLSQGDIKLFGKSIVNLAPNKRPVNTVFQHYALFPHLTVAANVGFGLQRQRLADNQISARVGEVLELVQLTAYADRLPSMLSGGQQQRVALARALAPRPQLLLLDEPLSALDLKLRQDVRVELQQIQHETGITFIFVTHDQEEALTMSDRIAVISEGVLQQVGTPKQVYEAPDNRFVADFIGDTNLLDVEVVAVQDDTATCRLPGGHTIVCPNAAGAPTGQGHLSVRPERVTIGPTDGAMLCGEVNRLTYLGTDIHVGVSLQNHGTMHVRVQNSQASSIPEKGTNIGLIIEAGAARLLVD